MIWCKKCVLPSTRPNLFIDKKDGICNACKFHQKRKKKYWNKKIIELKKIFFKAKIKSKNNYDCVIPVSGGKDSTWIVLTCLKYGLTPLAVTYHTPGRNNIGRLNLKNLVSLGVDHIDYTINPKVESYLILKTLKKKGSTAIPMHMGIFNIPLKIAKKFNIPLVVWGENSAAEYGAKKNFSIDPIMSKQWREKFGALNQTNHNFWEDSFLTKKKMIPFINERLGEKKIKSIFLGEYIKWDPVKILKIVKNHGFVSSPKVKTGIYNFADIDCNFISIHHYLKWLKFGFTRTFDNLSIEIRNNRITRKKALEVIRKHNSQIEPLDDIKNFCKFTGISIKKFKNITEKFRNKSIWIKKNNKWQIKNFIINNYSWK